MRLNLRPYRDRGGRPALLLESFLRSATAFSGDDRLLRESWSALGERLRGGPIGGIDLEGWRRLDAELARAGYPAAHHSAAYEAMRRPAYRVLTGDEAGVLAKSLASAR